MEYLEKLRRSKKRIYVLYHANCSDGFGAAWAFWLRLGNRAEYIPVSYGNPIPKIEDGSNVFILDFSYSREELVALHARCCLAVIDHHLTAEKELEGLDFAQFNQTFSGAYLAWLYAHPDEPVPSLIEYIQDRDLWKWHLENSREISAALASYPHDFDVWSGLSSGVGMAQLVSDGDAILRMTRKQVEFLCKGAFRAMHENLTFPVVNTPLYQSEVCEALLKDGASMAACFHDNAKGERVWSLRSNNKVDVAEIARKLGGGGHKNAAGFSTNNLYLLTLIHNRNP